MNGLHKYYKRIQSVFKNIQTIWNKLSWAYLNMQISRWPNFPLNKAGDKNLR